MPSPRDLVQIEKMPRQAFCGTRPSKAKFEMPEFVEPGEYRKPRRGLWTSTAETMYDDGWLNWCRGEHFADYDHAWLIQPAECRVITIDGPETCDRFHARYNVITERERAQARQYGFRASGGIDWELVCADCDAVRLLNPYHPDIRFGNPSTFYTWDCESTFWFRWMFTGKPERLPLVADLEVVDA